MTLSFSELPGSRERQLIRQYNNPLFPEAQRTVSAELLKTTQDEELAELQVFSNDFQDLLESASKLSENVQSDVILKLKEDADRLYEKSACLPGNNSETQKALVKFLTVIMQVVKTGAGNDAKALSELDQETEARSMHINLLKVPIIVDMLNPDSLITPENLAATLLSVENEELQAALQLFEAEQITQLYQDAKALLNECEQQGDDVSAAALRLETIASAVDAS